MQIKYDDTKGRYSTRWSSNVTKTVDKGLLGIFSFFFFFLVLGALKQQSSKRALSAGECVTRCTAIETLISVGLLRHESRTVVVDASTYSTDFCKSFKIAESSCVQFTSSEILINCLKCDTESGSSIMSGMSPSRAEDECGRFFLPSDSPSSNTIRVTRNTDGAVSFNTGPVVISMLDGSCTSFDMNSVWRSLSQ